MSVIPRHRAGSRRLRDAHPRTPRSRQEGSPGTSLGNLNPRERGGRVLFEVPFTSPMTPRQLELLRRQLDMTTHVERKLPVDPNSPGVARLDSGSALFLERGPDEARWVLQARTWVRPSAAAVRAWYLGALQVARQIDAQVAPVDLTGVVTGG